MAELTEIRWHGRGGQGVVTAGKLLAETAMGTGQYFQAFPDYGPERMGAPIRAYTRLSPEPITIHSQIEEPDVVLVLDPTLLGTVPVTEGLKEDGMLLVNTSMSPAEVRQITGFRTGKVFTVDASHIAIEEMGREITNTPMLGAFARVTGFFDIDDLAEQLHAWFGKKITAEAIEANVRAMRRAAEEVMEG
ncbi:MAG: pyruvate synthase [Chloroflexi bacterium]|nr:MAG: pyruvate synthase [Chloroflexota bacterium]RLC90837.1 MAG: pyruvate synthase [Chloroflexota bacterium]HEY68607.1 pyruvate synthase [Thermoflexia bacterium]